MSKSYSLVAVRGPLVVLQSVESRHTGIVTSQYVGSSSIRNWTRVLCIGGQILNHCITWEILSNLILSSWKRWNFLGYPQAYLGLHKCLSSQGGLQEMAWPGADSQQEGSSLCLCFVLSESTEGGIQWARMWGAQDRRAGVIQGLIHRPWGTDSARMKHIPGCRKLGCLYLLVNSVLIF